MTDESREEMQFVQDLMALKFAFIEGDIQYKSDKFGDSYKIWASRTIDNAIEHIVRSRTDYEEAVVKRRIFCEFLSKKNEKGRD